MANARRGTKRTASRRSCGGLGADAGGRSRSAGSWPRRACAGAREATINPHDPHWLGPCCFAGVRNGRAGGLLRDVHQRQPKLRNSLPGDVLAIGQRRRRLLPGGFHRSDSAELPAAHAQPRAAASAAVKRDGFVRPDAPHHDVAVHVAVRRYLFELPSLRFAAG